MSTRLVNVALFIVLVLGPAATLTGCGDEADDEGSPPSIANLTADQATAPINTTTVIQVTFDFMDQDGDADRVAAEIRAPDGAVQSIPPQTVQGMAGRSAGTVVVALVVMPQVTGVHEIDLWLVDQADNRSNTLTVTFEAT
jgi:hypothetical protein